VISAAILTFWYIPTQVAVEVVTRGLTFHTSVQKPQLLLEETSATSLALKGFETIAFDAEEVSIASQRNRNSASSWSRLPSPGQFLLVSAEDSGMAAQMAWITITSISGSASPLALDPIYTAAGGVTLKRPEPNVLTVSVQGMKGSVRVGLPREFSLEAAHCLRKGGPWPSSAQSVKLRVRLRGNSNLLEISPGKRRTMFQIQLPPETLPRWTASGIPLDRVEFLDLGQTGQPVSTLTGPGSIDYSDVPANPPVKLSQGDFLVLKELQNFRLLAAPFADDPGSFHVKLNGTAGVLQSGPPGGLRDRRITKREFLWATWRMEALTAMVVALVSGFAAVRKWFVSHGSKQETS
jgi:hypothetical protein